MLEALDRKIIEKLTKFSHWFQKLTGLTCYFFAKTGLFISILVLVLHAINYFWPILMHKSNSFYIFALFFIGYMFNKRIHRCNKVEENLFPSEIIRVDKENFGFRMFYLFASVVFFSIRDIQCVLFSRSSF